MNHGDTETRRADEKDSAWVPVLEAKDVAGGTVQVVEVDGRRLAVCNTGQGFYTIADVCTHDGGALDQGELMGCEIECPRHGARFDVTTGKVKALPAVRPVKTYPTRINDAGQVEVEVA